MISKKASRNIKTSIKIIIVLLSWIYVAYRISQIENISDFGNIFVNIEIEQILYLIAIIILMPINWFIEAIKWRNLLKQIENIKPFKALKAVWTGVTIGSLTPNRIGEFSGRIIFLKKEDRIIGSGLTLYGDLAQFIITFCLGLSSFIILLNSGLLSSEIKSSEPWVIITSLVVLFISMIIYFRINHIIKYISKFKILRRLTVKFDQKIELSTKLKLDTLLLSALRYLIFTTQFYLALRFFNIDISLIHAFLSISSVYLAATVIPNIPFAEIGIRLSFSIIFIGVFSDNTSAILLSSALIYLINVLFPVIFGGLALLKHDKNQ